MKKINKQPGPNELTIFLQDNATADWDSDFRSSNSGKDYLAIRRKIFSDQGGLCAYCETKVGVLPAHKQRVEHFHPKSDKATPSTNWALEWSNIIGVCIGGSDTNKDSYPLPKNLSCDSYKDHLIVRGELTEQCEGYLINPMEMFAFPCLLNMNKQTGHFVPDDTNCKTVNFSHNHIGTTYDLVEKTIEILNLNCDRLAQQRLAVLHEYNRLIKKAMLTNDRQIKSKLVTHWFHSKWLSFFTTRRILLGSEAETYLTLATYNG